MVCHNATLRLAKICTAYLRCLMSLLSSSFHSIPILSVQIDSDSLYCQETAQRNPKKTHKENVMRRRRCQSDQANP